MKLSTFLFNAKMKDPIRISFHTFYYRENVIVQLEHEGYVGLGEAAPFQPITGDTQSEVLQEAERLRDIPVDPEKDSPETLHQYLTSQNIQSQTLKAAVDFAFHDLKAKLQKKAIYQLYQPNAVDIINCMTVFIGETPEDMAREAAKAYADFPNLSLLKIKLNGDVDDIERVEAIKRVSPKKMRFTLDANQGFHDEKLAVKTLDRIGEVLGDVVLVEEPCPKGQLEKLKYVKENVNNMMVFADESAATLEDAKKVIEHSAAHGVNIKLQKAGGIWLGKQIADLCNEAGFKIMLGSMLESSIGIGAAMHFAVSTKGLILTDLDENGIANATRGSLMKDKSVIHLEETDGLGVELDFASIKEKEKTGEVIFEKKM